MLSCQVTAFNDQEAYTSVVTDSRPRTSAPWSPQSVGLAALRNTIIGMALAAAPTERLTSKVDSISHWITRGENVCEDLDEFNEIVADLLEHRKVTAEQATTLTNAANAIKANSPTPC